MAHRRIGTLLGSLGLLLWIGCGDSAPASQGPLGAAGSGSAMMPAPSQPMMTPTAAQSPSSGSPQAMSPSTPMQQPSQTPSMMPSNPPAANGGMMPSTPAMPTTPMMQEPMGKPLAMDECGLKTQYAGDEYCINAPPADKGFQVHVGPTDYENPEPQYILAPGQEITNNFTVTSTNTTKKFFYYRQFRMRPGAHHNILSSTAGGGFGMGRRIGTSNHLAEDSPKGGIPAPENEGVGIEIGPNQTINVSLHSINLTDKPALREVWVNFWYKDEAEVTESVEQMFQAGDTSFAVQPRQETTLGPYKCTIEGEGRMLWFYGHRHANNVRFSAWRNRGAQRDLFYEGLNWEDPIVLEYASNVKNTAPDRAKNIEGGWSGILDMKPGDVLEWECHIVNKTDEVLRFTNETYTGEMCIMDAELVGANCPTRGGGAPPGGFTPEL